MKIILRDKLASPERKDDVKDVILIIIEPISCKFTKNIELYYNMV